MKLRKECTPRSWHYELLDAASTSLTVSRNKDRAAILFDLAKKFKMCTEEIEYKEVYIASLEKRITELEYKLKTLSQDDTKPSTPLWIEL
jgi:hypothetical protein